MKRESKKKLKEEMDKLLVEIREIKTSASTLAQKAYNRLQEENEKSLASLAEKFSGDSSLLLGSRIKVSSIRFKYLIYKLTIYFKYQEHVCCAEWC